MTITRIWKDHSPRWGKKLGQTERFVVEPRQRDSKYLIKKVGVKGNRDECYDPVDTLDQVWQHLQDGRSVRMKGQRSGDWNTLNGEGAQHA